MTVSELRYWLEDYQDDAEVSVEVQEYPYSTIPGGIGLTVEGSENRLTLGVRKWKKYT
jgi:hypothetical protein